jgi:hypothetical protein
MPLSGKTKLVIGALIAGALTLGGAAGVYAQQSANPPAVGAPQGPPGRGMGPGGRGMRGPGGPGMGQGMGMGGQRLDPAEMQKRRDERRAEMTQRMHDILQITPAQEGAWKTYQDALKPPNFTPPTQAQIEARRTMTTPQRIDERMARMTERTNAMKARADATKRFYNVLNPAQKKAFDTIGEGMRERGRAALRDGRGGRGGGMRGPGGPGGPMGPNGPMGGPPPT